MDISVNKESLTNLLRLDSSDNINAKILVAMAAGWKIGAAFIDHDDKCYKIMYNDVYTSITMISDNEYGAWYDAITGEVITDYLNSLTESMKLPIKHPKWHYTIVYCDDGKGSVRLSLFTPDEELEYDYYEDGSNLAMCMTKCWIKYYLQCVLK